MPLKMGNAPETIKANFAEQRQGPLFKQTENKFGKAKAVKQMQAVVLSTARKKPVSPLPIRRLK